MQYLEKVIYEFNRRKINGKRLSSKEIHVNNDEPKAEEISEEKEETFYDCLTTPATLSEAHVKSGRLLTFSYGLCLAVVYAQLTMLLYMVSFCAFRLGFLFLLACVAAIAYIVVKVSEKEELCQDCPQKKLKLIKWRQFSYLCNDYPKCINFCKNKNKSWGQPISLWQFSNLVKMLGITFFLSSKEYPKNTFTHSMRASH